MAPTFVEIDMSLSLRTIISLRLQMAGLVEAFQRHAAGSAPSPMTRDDVVVLAA